MRRIRKILHFCLFICETCRVYRLLRPLSYCAVPLPVALSRTVLPEQQVERGFARSPRFFSISESAGMLRGKTDQQLLGGSTSQIGFERDGAAGAERDQCASGSIRGAEQTLAPRR